MVDQQTLEVYGHLIGSDIFGHGRVVPLRLTISQIKILLNAQRVTLPTEKDQVSSLDSHTHQSPTPGSASVETSVTHDPWTSIRVEQQTALDLQLSYLNSSSPQASDGGTITGSENETDPDGRQTSDRETRKMYPHRLSMTSAPPARMDPWSSTCDFISKMPPGTSEVTERTGIQAARSATLDAVWAPEGALEDLFSAYV